MVSVSCPAYNHEAFIEDALKGFLMQKTNFRIEILINDDASNDRTPEIIRTYESQFPQLIKATYQVKNQFNGRTPEYITPPVKKGKYLIFCEGDDYWTDPLKLQKQVDFLEAHDDFVICHHNMKVIYTDTDQLSHLSNSPDQKEVTTIIDLAWGNYIFTASALFRYGLIPELPPWFSQCVVQDYPTHMLNAQYGKIKYMPEVMGVYRVHKHGVWECRDIVYRTKKWAEMLELIKNYFSPEVNQILKESLNLNYAILLEHSRGQRDKCLEISHKMIENNPYYLTSLLEECKSSHKSLANLFEKLNQINEEVLIIKKEYTQFAYESLRLKLKFEMHKENTLADKSSNIADEDILLVGESGLFNTEYYLWKNNDVKEAGVNPLLHFCEYGWKEGRNPSSIFDLNFYSEQYPDVKQLDMNPLLHFLKYGYKEGRKINRL